MTMKEADEAAWKFLPVIYNGIEYKRITQTGYNYVERKGRRPFVQLQSKYANSVVYADPALCEIPEYAKRKTEKEQEHEPNNERDTPGEL